MKRTLNSTVLSLVLLVVTAVCITASGILYKQPLLHILPLYISLFISLLQSRVNRIAYLIGAGNAILYAIVYWHFRLYASAVYAILFSCTIQLATYFLWSKHPSGKATIFRAMKPRQRIGMVRLSPFGRRYMRFFPHPVPPIGSLIFLPPYSEFWCRF